VTLVVAGTAASAALGMAGPGPLAAATRAEPGRLAVAALSARLLADAAGQEGFAVLALDLFGDADTRRAALGWRSLAGGAAGEVPGMAAGGAAWRIDETRLLQGLREAARLGACGWLAGSGFEAQPELLDAGQAVLPLLGLAGDGMRRLREPQAFFAALAAHGVPHPVTQLLAPSTHDGWLIKNSRACGGGHVRPARPGEPALAPHHLAQRWAPGLPMSATFVADGRSATVLGFNRLLVAGQGAQPHQFVGAIGPVAVPAPAAQVLRQALHKLVPEFGLVGLGSLDFLLHGTQVAVLEVNARPPATVALHGAQRPITAHLAACAAAVQPLAANAGPASGLPPVLASDTDTAAPVQGFATVFARQARRAGPALAAALAALPHGHDLPHTGDLFVPGSPVCSVSAQAADAHTVQQLLAERCARVHHLLETTAP